MGPVLWFNMSVHGPVVIIIQALIQGGTVPLTSPSTSRTWLWFALRWRTMITRQTMTSWASTPCHSPVCVQVCVHSRVWMMSSELLTCFFVFSGYRHVRLMKMDGSSLSPSSLFIYVKVSTSHSPSKSEAKSLARKPWSQPGHRSHLRQRPATLVQRNTAKDLGCHSCIQPRGGTTSPLHFHTSLL